MELVSLRQLSCGAGRVVNAGQTKRLGQVSHTLIYFMVVMVIIAFVTFFMRFVIIITRILGKQICQAVEILF